MGKEGVLPTRLPGALLLVECIAADRETAEIGQVVAELVHVHDVPR